jgi:hypothetical protein
LLVFGEIRTCLLQSSRAVPLASVAELLRLLPGERVRFSERPTAHASSPETLTGIDCQLPTASGARCRGVGTVTARAVVTGGRVLQGSVYAAVERGPADHRLPWPHYLARPGVVQTIGKFGQRDVIDGFLAGHAPTHTLDLGAVSERLIGSVQLSPRLDHLTPLRTKRTRLRWAARIGEPDCSRDSGEFVVADDVVRTLELELAAGECEDVLGFCENLALHDWALSTLQRAVERSELDSDTGSVVALRPVIEHLLPLWMPGAHVAEAMLPMWESLERRPGFTRQWETMVAHIRDQLSLTMLAALNPDLRLS